jgi:alkanesulfonate monooxygenase SsuD/methylene tetrahydromethanopterin reductase-like flavin-dependent oxidoreductase (luciferase family)
VENRFRIDGDDLGVDLRASSSRHLIRHDRSPAGGMPAHIHALASNMTKRIGFLSFGHYQDVPGSRTPTAREALVQSIELAVAAEEIGIDSASVRVHHFAKQLASPFPLLAAMAARTSRIELGTGIIDMRYENPLSMAEQAAAADLISAGRLQLGVSRGSPETSLRGHVAERLVPAATPSPRATPA